MASRGSRRVSNHSQAQASQALQAQLSALYSDGSWVASGKRVVKLQPGPAKPFSNRRQHGGCHLEQGRIMHSRHGISEG